MVCDKVVCVRKMVCDKAVCERWCVEEAEEEEERRSRNREVQI